MNNETWNKMSNQDKFNYLSSAKKELKQMSYVDGNSKVGDDARGGIAYWVEAGGVVISEKFKSEADAFNRAEEVIKSWGDHDGN